MISGTKTQAEGAPTPYRRLLRRAAAWLLLVCAVPAFAFDLSALMALLATQRSGEAEFSELRFVSGLDQPLTASGTLSFSAPDHFVRKTLKPRAETMAVAGNTLTLARGGRSRSVTLDSAPEMAGLVEAVRGTLTGNAQTLQRHFTPELSGSVEQWTLALTPLDPRMAGQVRVIHIGGRHAELSRIEMQLRDGDRSLMTITPMRPASAAVTAPAASAP